KPSLYFELAAG
ncbi:hypothetical protein D030_1548, partial [Vibrio parahaemolyticus AQ3810]